MFKNREINVKVQISIFSVVLILSIVLNIFIILVIFSRRKLRTRTNYLLANLAISDLLVTCAMITETNINLSNDTKTLVGFKCDILGVLPVFLFMVSIMNLMLISVHRFILIAKKSIYETIFSLKRLRLLIICVWMFSLFIGLLTMTGLGRYNYQYYLACCTLLTGVIIYILLHL